LYAENTANLTKKGHFQDYGSTPDFRRYSSSQDPGWTESTIQWGKSQAGIECYGTEWIFSNQLELVFHFAWTGHEFSNSVVRGLTVVQDGIHLLGNGHLDIVFLREAQGGIRG
jgi:hypothetical protein